MLTALPRLFERLALRLASAQDMAENGNYSSAFGYLEESVKVALETFHEAELILEGAGVGGSAEVQLPAYDVADVWAGVASHPLFPVDR